MGVAWLEPAVRSPGRVPHAAWGAQAARLAACEQRCAELPGRGRMRRVRLVAAGAARASCDCGHEIAAESETARLRKSKARARSMILGQSAMLVRLSRLSERMCCAGRLRCRQPVDRMI